ncbi:MAG: ABC transporter permease [Caldilineae bacterium]|nr:MAG: ABC transporter permease [Caldilineae bacterium]
MSLAAVVLFNEIYKRLLHVWAYKFNFFTQMFMIGFIFIGISFFMAGGAPRPEALAPAFLGYLVWFYALAAISDMSWGVREETQTGTMEQMYMSPLPTGFLMIGRSVASLLVSTLLVGVTGVAMILFFKIPLPVRWAGLPVFLLTMAGLYGFAFILAGATLVFKQVEALANLLQNALLFLNGALLPVDRLPGWMETFAKTLPTTQGIIVLRRVILGGASLAETWQDGSLVWLTVHSSIYFVLGWFFFKWCEHRARQMGALGQY